MLSSEPLNLDNDQTYESLFDFIYSDFVDSLAAKYCFHRARTLGAAQRYLSDPAKRSVAILLPDPAVTLKDNSSVLE
jgi:hypothetical protein